MSRSEVDVHSFQRRSVKIRDLMIQEARLASHPYIDIHALCDGYDLSPPKMSAVMQTLKEMGHETVRTHFRPTAVRTTASVEEVLRVVQELTGGN